MSINHLNVDFQASQTEWTLLRKNRIWADRKFSIFNSWSTKPDLYCDVPLSFLSAVVKKFVILAKNTLTIPLTLERQNTGEFLTINCQDKRDSSVEGKVLEFIEVQQNEEECYLTAEEMSGDEVEYIIETWKLEKLQDTISVS